MTPRSTSAVMLALLLAACGGEGGGKGSLGVTSSVDASTSSSQGDSLERTKSISQGKTEKATIQMPAGVLIADALRAIADPRIPGWQTADPTSLSVYPAEAALARLVASATEPVIGWPADPMDASARVTRWMASAAATAETANAVVTEIATRIGERPLADPQAAKEAIWAVFAGLSHADLIQDWRERRGSIRNPTIDLSGGRIRFTTGDGRDITIDQRGIVETRNGAAWFGDGALSGRKYELALESSISATRSKQQSTSDKSDTSTTRKTTGEAGIR